MMIEVSVVVPIYNVGDYIEKCIRSICAQTFTNLEILLIDDGSTDNSLKICRELCSTDKRIRVISQENSGVSVARNKGIENARGEWICFVDGDDYLPENAIEILHRSANENACDICIGDYFVDAGDGKAKYSEFILDKKDTIFCIDELIENCMVGNKQKDNVTCIGVPWAKLYRRSYILDNNLRYKIGMCRNQDVHFNLYAFFCAERVVYCAQPVYYYRVWEGSAVNRFSPQYINTAEEILKAFETFFIDKQIEESLWLFFEQRAIFMFYECLRLKIFHKENRMSIKEKYSEFRNLMNNTKVSLRYRRKEVLSKNQKVQVWLCEHGLSAVSYLFYSMKMKIR